MSYDLSKLGWSAFQDLACTVAAEVLRRPVQTFLGSRDGGRDGAFLGSWASAEGDPVKSTIQCKFIGRPDASLTLTTLKPELLKARELVGQGLADEYIILTNAGVSGEGDRQICAAFQAVGVRRCQIFGGTWIVQQLKERPRLRMLVPRVYGIGDLSQVIVEHSYRQAKAILDSMGSDLGCFVATDAYRAAVTAINEHGFVLLTGDPASGKSTIAAILALGALDDGCVGAVKINSPDQLHLWHPGERQFLWVDDAFGPNQFDAARMNRWNAELGTLRAAIEQGARIVFTSRNYIWEAARPHLKISAFPLFKESQVVVNVHELTEPERAQMLYNHVRRAQPQAMRRRLKPLLPAVAANPAFLPETARRLGDPLFTQKLALTPERVKKVVEQPVEFLTEILGQLDAPSRAAVALVFLNSQGGVTSPIMPTPELELVTRLLGVRDADVSQAMQHLNDSLTRLLHGEDGSRWVFRHPTVTDAFATLVAASPELVELYARGAKPDRLVTDAYCGVTGNEDARVRIPASLYATVIDRLRDQPIDEYFKAFLGVRCGKPFLTQMLDARPDIIEWAAKTAPSGLSLGGKVLLTTLHDYGLLPEAIRAQIVASLIDASITWLGVEPMKDKVMTRLFTDDEMQAYEAKFKAEWLSDPSGLFDDLRSRFSSEDERDMFTEFRESLKVAQAYFKVDDPDGDFEALFDELDTHIRKFDDYDGHSGRSNWSPDAPYESEAKGSTTIFDDVDD